MDLIQQIVGGLGLLLLTTINILIFRRLEGLLEKIEGLKAKGFSSSMESLVVNKLEVREEFKLLSPGSDEILRSNFFTTDKYVDTTDLEGDDGTKIHNPEDNQSEHDKESDVSESEDDNTDSNGGNSVLRLDLDSIKLDYDSIKIDKSEDHESGENVSGEDFNDKENPFDSFAFKYKVTTNSDSYSGGNRYEEIDSSKDQDKKEDSECKSKTSSSPFSKLRNKRLFRSSKRQSTENQTHLLSLLKNKPV